ncbi:Asx homology domain-containing protein [Cyathus striatus]|nr:Asx homology domain-containing protein [Cyathus striatus]
MSARPRRSIRQTEKAQAAASEPTITPLRSKRKATEPGDPKEQLKCLLQNPKSKLTTIELSDVINVGAWNLLSQESQCSLRNLLPPTAFSGYNATIEANHPSVLHTRRRNEDNSVRNDDLNHATFTDSHFLAAANTFQDHIYLNWTSDSHLEKVQRFQEGIRSGILAAPWKDETWEREHVTVQSMFHAEATKATTPARVPAESLQRAGGASEVKLTTLVKHHIIKVGDVLAYRRNFSSIDLVLEKDCIIQHIHPTSYSITVLTELGPTKFLAPSVVMPVPGPRFPEDASESTRSMDATSPSMLENALLDLDGRVDRSKRPNGNAWKCFTVWRRRENAIVSDDQNGRAGRECYGTLFYLRGSFYHDQ